jgi:hypothetical protein
MVAVVIWAWPLGFTLPDSVLGWFKLYWTISIVTCSVYSFTVQMFPSLLIAWEAYKHANAAPIRTKLHPDMLQQDVIIIEQVLF